MNGSISFLVTALNEEAHLLPTIHTIESAAAQLGCDYEILVVNDGSVDATGRIADQSAALNPRVRAIHNQTNLGLGGAYKRAVHMARKEFVMWICGDNSETSDHIVNVASHVGEADIVLPVLRAGRKRPFFRRATSKAFTTLVNMLFGLRVSYYNGTVIHQTALIAQVPIRTNSFAYQAEALVKMLRAGCSYIEIPYSSQRYDGLFSNAMKPKNLFAVARALFVLFGEVRCKGYNLELVRSSPAVCTIES
jgi:glycosyltransferase involved in cell wall biosynthesis